MDQIEEKYMVDFQTKQIDKMQEQIHEQNKQQQPIRYGDKIDDSILLSSRPQVRQCWDNVLTVVQKSYLPEIIEQRQKYERLRQLAKKKKKEDLENRRKIIEKIKSQRK